MLCSAAYWVRTWGTGGCRAKYRVNKNKNERTESQRHAIKYSDAVPHLGACHKDGVCAGP